MGNRSTATQKAIGQSKQPGRAQKGVETGKIHKQENTEEEIFCLRFALIYIPSHILHKLKRNYIQVYKYTSEF